MIQIKRLKLNNLEFVPITLSEAVVVNCNNIAGLSSYGITTLEKILTTAFGIIGLNRTDIDNLIINKQDKLIPGAGIEILEDGTINVIADTTLYIIERSLPTPSEDCLNKIYLIPSLSGSDRFDEYICYEENNSYYWELIGSIASEVDLSGYLTEDKFNTYIETEAIQSENVTSSTGIPITVDYTIPPTIYDYLVE